MKLNSIQFLHYVLAKTQSELTQKLHDKIEMYRDADLSEDCNMTLGEWLDIPEIGTIPLNKLTQSDLQQFYARTKSNGRRIRVEAYGAGLSDRAIRAIHANCRSALEKAIQEGLIRTNPAIGCKMPPKKSREMNVLTQNEVIRFLNQAKEEGYYRTLPT